MSEVHDFILSNHLGDYASLVGLLVALLGFAATLVNVARSRRAAASAQAAAEQVRIDLRRADSTVELSETIKSLEDVKRLHRAEAWKDLIPVYDQLRGRLVVIRTGNPDLSESDQTDFQEAITHLRQLEMKAERVLQGASPPKDIARLNGIINDQMDKLQAILITLRDGIGR